MTRTLSSAAFTVTDHHRRRGVTGSSDTLTTMQLQSECTSTCWVFVRHSQCIQVSTRELCITIEGPLHARDKNSFGSEYSFGSEQDLQSFQMTLAEQLSERGWMLCASKSA